MTAITQQALKAIHVHAEEGYPHEICGMLVGAAGSDLIAEVVRARNLITERARDRYEIDPIDQIRLQKECDATGKEILGFYHSHPDHPAKASVFDAERSWEGPIYIIVSVMKGKVADTRGWLAEKDGGPMTETEVAQQ